MSCGRLVTEVDSLQKIVAAQEARLQVLEGGPRPLLQVGDAGRRRPAGASASGRRCESRRWEARA